MPKPKTEHELALEATKERRLLSSNFVQRTLGDQPVSDVSFGEARLLSHAYTQYEPSDDVEFLDGDIGAIVMDIVTPLARQIRDAQEADSLLRNEDGTLRKGIQPDDPRLDSNQNTAAPLPSLDEEVRMVDPDTGGEKGSKLARYDLIPVRPLESVANHYGVGARKYAERNWEKGYNWSLSFAALQRHAQAFWGGEDIDAETGQPHMSAVVFHALALLEFAETHPEKDDRPKRA